MEGGENSRVKLGEGGFINVYTSNRHFEDNVSKLAVWGICRDRSIRMLFLRSRSDPKMDQEFCPLHQGKHEGLRVKVWVTAPMHTTVSPIGQPTLLM